MVEAALISMVLIGAVVLLLRVPFVAGRVFMIDSEEYGELMMAALDALDTSDERREYLQSNVHVGRVTRCFCGVYALPFQGTRVLTNDLTHESRICQPNLEAIGLP